jgi:hypothetical protein
MVGVHCMSRANHFGQQIGIAQAGRLVVSYHGLEGIRGQIGYDGLFLRVGAPQFITQEVRQQQHEPPVPCRLHHRAALCCKLLVKTPAGNAV